MNLRLTDELREFVNRNSGADTPYASPREYVVELLRQHKLRQEAGAAREVIVEGYQDTSADPRRSAVFVSPTLQFDESTGLATDQP